MSQLKKLEKALVDFYGSNNKYFSLMEKRHNEGYYRPVLRVFSGTKPILKGKKVLDIGSGAGTFLRVLKKLYGEDFEMVGTDITPIAKKYHQDKKIRFVKADAQKLPFNSKTFDYVFSIDVLEHIVDPQQAIEEMYRVTKKDGLMLVRTRNYCSPFSTTGLMLIVETIRSLLKKGDLRKTRRLKPNLSSSGGDEDAVSAILAQHLKLSIKGLGGEILVFETWTKGGLWGKLNNLLIIKDFGSMCLVLFKK